MKELDDKVRYFLAGETWKEMEHIKARRCA